MLRKILEETITKTTTQLRCLGNNKTSKRKLSLFVTIKKLYTINKSIIYCRLLLQSEVAI